MKSLATLANARPRAAQRPIEPRSWPPAPDGSSPRANRCHARNSHNQTGAATTSKIRPHRHFHQATSCRRRRWLKNAVFGLIEEMTSPQPRSGSPNGRADILNASTPFWSTARGPLATAQRSGDDQTSPTAQLDLKVDSDRQAAPATVLLTVGVDVTSCPSAPFDPQRCPYDERACGELAALNPVEPDVDLQRAA